MVTFLIGLTILFFGYVFYSKYVEKQFCPSAEPTPANTMNDGMDYVPLTPRKNMLIQLLNIAGIGPILGAVQGILFGPIAFLIIPLGCIFMGGVHDYFSGMLSVRHRGMQITGLIKEYLGKNAYVFFIFVVSLMLIFVSAVFVYTSGDLIAERAFRQSDFSLTNPVMLVIYSIIILYYILATLFPIDKIIGRFYPMFGLLLLVGTGLVAIGFFVHGIDLQELNFAKINENPKSLALIPFFFMTVSCGLLSGFHSTQSTIISRTLNSEYDGKKVFYGMMCVESLIAMVWAAGAMHVYSNNLVPTDFVGKANVINIIANNFVPYVLTYVVTLAVVVLPITSGDTALRGLRMIIAEALKINQSKISNRLIIVVPLLLALVGILVVAKTDNESFFLVWRYFTFENQLIVIPTFFFTTLYLYKNYKNYIMALLPGLFYVFVTMTFILNAKIGFNLSMKNAEIIAAILVIVSFVWLKTKMVRGESDGKSELIQKEEIETKIELKK